MLPSYPFADAGGSRQTRVPACPSTIARASCNRPIPAIFPPARTKSLAAVIFGRWEPVRVAVACLLFAGAETLQIQLQGSQLIPSQFVEMIPYVLTIVALAGVVGRSVAPAALGKTE